MPSGAPRFRPFEDLSWPHEKADAPRVLREWCEYLEENAVPDAHSDRYIRDAERIDEGLEPVQIPRQLAEKIWTTCGKHDLPLNWFTSPLRVVHRFKGPLRFSDVNELKEFLNEWYIPRANVLARLAGVAHSWQLQQVSELAMAFFLVDRLIRLPEDMERDRLFIPVKDLDQADVTVDMLKAGEINPQIGKLLWKQAIRIRDAFAQGQPLVHDLERRYRRSFKFNWLTGLEFVNEIERRKYDLWSAPIELSGLHLLQVRILSWIGKGAGQARSR